MEKMLVPFADGIAHNFLGVQLHLSHFKMQTTHFIHQSYKHVKRRNYEKWRKMRTLDAFMQSAQSNGSIIYGRRN